MPKYETSNILLSLAGDTGNTVPKYGVTVGEIAILQAIHGNEAVTDIEPVSFVERSNRQELDRLKAMYGGATDGNQNRLVDLLFPGVAARVFETLDELALPDDFFKAETRVRRSVETTAPAKIEDIDLTIMNKGQLVDYAKTIGFDADITAKKDTLIASIQSFIESKNAALAAQLDEGDGIDDMNDVNVMN